MNITKVSLIKGEWGKVRAMASVVFEDCFLVSGFKILEGINGLFVSMPQAKIKEEYKDTAFPITKEFREMLITAILGEYGIDNHVAPKQAPVEGFVPVTPEDDMDDFDRDLPF